MIVGEHFAFDIRPAHLHGSDWIVLEMVGESGERIGCRWHVDAAPREIAEKPLPNLHRNLAKPAARAMKRGGGTGLKRTLTPLHR